MGGRYRRFQELQASRFTPVQPFIWIYQRIAPNMWYQQPAPQPPPPQPVNPTPQSDDDDRIRKLLQGIEALSAELKQLQEEKNKRELDRDVRRY